MIIISHLTEEERKAVQAAALERQRDKFLKSIEPKVSMKLAPKSNAVFRKGLRVAWSANGASEWSGTMAARKDGPKVMRQDNVRSNFQHEFAQYNGSKD